MYENNIANLKTFEGWSEEINCVPCLVPFLAYTLVKLEECLEDTGCGLPTLIGIVITILFYANGISILARKPYNLVKQLRIHQDFCSSIGTTSNIDKKKS